MNFNAIDLTDNDQRDANLSTLEAWHPAFYEIVPTLQPAIASFRAAMLDYSRLLLDECPSDTPLELLEHLQVEVTSWMTFKLRDEATDAFRAALRNNPPLCPLAKRSVLQE